MMRVTKIAATEANVWTFRVEGRLTRHTAEELRMACEAVLAESGDLRLDLSGLQFVDVAGASLLHDLERRGTSLAGGSEFIGAVLAGTRDATPAGMPSAEGAEEDLLPGLRCGDAAAFERLVRRHGGRMLSVARRFVGGEDEARDVVQEAFIAAFRSIDTFAGTARLGTWLHRIVVNCALMKLRTRRRRREEPIETLLPRFAEDGRWAEQPADWDTATDTLLGRHETRVRVRRAIELLPEGYRTVLMLRDIEELDTDETASLLDMTPNAVKTRLHRARQALRTLLERELVGPSCGDGGVPEARAGRGACAS